MSVNLTEVAQSANKAIGALVGGGVITLLVGVHVIPVSVGNTILTVLAAAAAVLGAFLAPRNKPLVTGVTVPDDEVAGVGVDAGTAADDASSDYEARHPSPGPVD